MRTKSALPLVALLVFSFACQTLLPAAIEPRDGVVITHCPDLLYSIRGMQTYEVPQGLMETGIKQGDEFDVNEYFTVTPNLSMQEGYVLDYVFISDSLGSFPLLAARPADQEPYKTSSDVSSESEFAKYWNYVEVNDTEQGYFEYASFLRTANQFYLVWHANYNDINIICDREAVDAIVTDINDGGFGMEFDRDQMRQINALKNIEPLVKLTDTTAIVELVIFSKWGGFYRITYIISRSSPHEIIDRQEENIIPYDCGIMF
ncbi:MAG: hypothetical protein RIR73_144 [Chloroflexota bacterium]